MSATLLKGTQIASSTIQQSNLNLADPSGAQDAVTLNYLRNLAANKTIKMAARLVLLATDFTFASFNTGTGVLTTSANITTADGVAFAVGDRILIPYLTGTNQKYNGIFTVTTLSGASQFTRATDASTSGTGNYTDLVIGSTVNVTDGSTMKATQWELGLPAAGQETLTLNTDNVVWLDMTPSIPVVHNFSIRETPSGTLNGSNVTFTLAHTPVSGYESLFVNGQLQDAGSGNDYTISGGTITMATAPASTDKLRCSYQY